MRVLMILLISFVWARALWADDLAFVVANENYRNLSDARGADEAVGAARVFAQLGFKTVTAAEANAESLAQSVDQFIALAPEADRVVVVLSGRFVQSGQEAWLLPVDIEQPDLGTVPRQGLALSTVLTVLSRHPGQAVLVVGAPDEGEPFDARYLRNGIGTPLMPQGVTLFAGAPRGAADFAKGALAQPDARIIPAAARSGLRSAGFMPRDLSFAPKAEALTPEARAAAQSAAWREAVALDTEEGYLDYLQAYPDGPNAAEALKRIDAIRAEPFREERLAEEALTLSRDARRDIQRDLSLLGFNTRGIDGIFGPGTRGAIGAWQRQSGHGGSGYLTTDQITQLDQQAEVRAAELEAEAEARRAQIERQDRAYWNQTGAAGDEAGLRAYLGRYPDGLFAEVAQARLDVIEEQKRAQAAAQDRASWDTARNANSQDSYAAYLTQHPNGAFVADANAAIAALTASDENAIDLAAAQAAEEALNLDLFTMRLVEGRLSKMQFKPGPVDGVFDDKTRRAIRRYQESREMEPTGYLNEGTVVQLLADSIFGQPQ